MINRRQTLQWMPALAALLAGCAGVVPHERPHVYLLSLDPQGSSGGEFRFLARLRVQNPNDVDIPYNGISLDLQLRGQSVATGVTNAAGTVPRYGETVIEIPISVSAVHLVQQALGIFLDRHQAPVEYVLKGRIGLPYFGSMPFESKGTLNLPSGLS